MSRVAVRLVVRGHVQGVGYRWWTKGQARRLKLDGWVRNRRDGSVEILAAGTPGALDQLVEACRRGPVDAEVASVERFDADDPGVGPFEERPTA